VDNSADLNITMIIKMLSNEKLIKLGVIEGRSLPEN